MQVGSMERRMYWLASCSAFRSRGRMLMPTSLRSPGSMSCRGESWRIRSRVSNCMSCKCLLRPLIHRSPGRPSWPGCGTSSEAVECLEYQLGRSERWRARSDDFVRDCLPRRVYGSLRHVWDEEVIIISLSAFVSFSRMFSNCTYLWTPFWLWNFDP